MNSGSCSFLLVVARKPEWQGGARETYVSICKWVRVESEGWWLHSVGAEVKRKLVLPPSGCWDSVGVGALSQLVLVIKGCSLYELVLIEDEM